MIRRKDTLGYTDFMRGKFSVNQKFYILNMCKQMTNDEKELLLKKYHLVKNGSSVVLLKEKILQLIHGVTFGNDSYDLQDIILLSNTYETWTEPEWGFPKGRRNAQESDFECAKREFSEETGFSSSQLKNIRNIIPPEEIFTGSNYNSYRHKYYLMYLPYEVSIKNHDFQRSEISDMEWKSFEMCLQCIRPYNFEKKKVITNVYACLNSMSFLTLC